MAIYQYSAILGTSIPFSVDPLFPDLLVFDAGYSADLLTLTQVGSDVQVWSGSQSLNLLGITINQLQGSQFWFPDGSLVLLGTAAADNLTGSIANDYIDITSGGADVVSASGGNDLIYATVDSLTSGSSIDGGSGIDALFLFGSSATPIVLSATSIASIENIVLNTSGPITLQLNQGNVNNVESGYALSIFDSSLYVDCALTVDGATQGVTTGFLVDAGAGNDILLGGLGNDFFSGGGGSDYLYGGGGADILSTSDFGLGPIAVDLLDGGAGNDWLMVLGTNGGAGHTLTGGSGADTFQIGHWFGDGLSLVSAPVQITDFNAAEGDRLDIGSNSGTYYWHDIIGVWRGVATPGSNGFALDFNGSLGQTVGGSN